MSVQMTIRVDDELAAFVDHAAGRGEGSRADIINQALRRELRRRDAARDARIYAASPPDDLESESHAAWAAENARRLCSELD